LFAVSIKARLIKKEMSSFKFELDDNSQWRWASNLTWLNFHTFPNSFFENHSYCAYKYF
jgi:hypothetical protein